MAENNANNVDDDFLRDNASAVINTFAPPHSARMRFFEKVAAEFECPVCYGYVFPPIMQCINGHLICGNCRSRVDNCPMCRCALGNIRNTALERFASDLFLSCIHRTHGCPIVTNYLVLQEHQEICEYRQHLCPCAQTLPGCNWEGPLTSIARHLVDVHVLIRRTFGQTVWLHAGQLNLPGPACWVMLQYCLGRHFLMVLQKEQEEEAENQCFYFIVQLIGNREDASNFVYRLDLNSDVCLYGKPHSIFDESSVVVNRSFALRRNVIYSMATNYTLHIRVSIRAS